MRVRVRVPGRSGELRRPGGGYLRSEQGEADGVQRGEVAGSRSRSAHAAHLNTKPHNTLLIVRGSPRRPRRPRPAAAPRTPLADNYSSAAAARDY